MGQSLPFLGYIIWQKGRDGHSQDSFLVDRRESPGLDLRTASSWDQPLANSQQKNRDPVYKELNSVNTLKEVWGGPQALEEKAWPTLWFQPRETLSRGPKHITSQLLTYIAWCVMLTLLCSPHIPWQVISTSWERDRYTAGSFCAAKTWYSV